MKKYLFLSLMAYSVLTNAQKRKAVSTNTTDTKVATTYSCPDFRSMRWGTSRDSIYVNGIQVLFSKGNSKADTGAWYIVGDNMAIGTVTCLNIYYYFNAAGRLNKVKLAVPKYDKGEMKFILTTKFDEPTQVSDLMNGYQCIWNNIEEVRIHMFYFDDPINFLTVEFNSDFENVESKRINREVDDF